MESQLELLDNMENYAVGYLKESQPDIMTAYSAHSE